MSIFDEVPPFLPIDRVARRVTKKGEHWEPRQHGTASDPNKTFQAPPVCDPAPDWHSDYTGIRRGRLTAFCHFGKRKGGGGDRLWIVRCDCGLYEKRRINKFVSHYKANDACERCNDANISLRGQALCDKAGENYTPEPPKGGRDEIPIPPT